MEDLIQKAPGGILADTWVGAQGQCRQILLLVLAHLVPWHTLAPVLSSPAQLVFCSLGVWPYYPQD